MIFTENNTEGYSIEQLNSANEIAEKLELNKLDLTDPTQKAIYDRDCRQILLTIDRGKK